MLSSVPSIAFTIIGFGLLILIHEAGHFLMAKRARIRAHHFAIGFGPVLCSYRPGVGWAAGTTARATLAKLRACGVEDLTTVEDTSREALERHGIGETQYELRLLPLGGFVGMAGQDDANPGARSDAAGSFNRASLGARMWVISGGVIANLLLGILLFGVAFWHGVEFEAPTIGAVVADSPAQKAGLRAGDTILSINGEGMETFTDCRVATALSAAGKPLSIVVSRLGSADERETLTLEATPADGGTGIRQIGISPSLSLRVDTKRLTPVALDALARLGVMSTGGNAGGNAAGNAGVLTVVSANGRPVWTWEELNECFAAAHGAPVNVSVSSGIGSDHHERSVALSPVPPIPVVLVPTSAPQGGPPEAELSIAGLAPLTMVKDVVAGGAAAGHLFPGDIVLRVGDHAGPTMRVFRGAVQAAKGASISLTVERAGQATDISLAIPRSGVAGVYLGLAMDDARVAQPLTDWMEFPGGDDLHPEPTPAGAAHILPLSKITALNGVAIASWRDFAVQSRAAAEAAPSTASAVALSLSLELPTAERPTETVALTLGGWALAAERSAQWTSPLTPDLFLPNQVVLSAAGHPLRAVGMGFHQTGVILTNVFLTLRALVQGDVGVNQLSGPLGIVHAGTMAAEKSSWYLLFFLALISVNLAFLNALPIPIADGGHMVYLLWEAVTGKMPSPRFQNAAAIVGLAFFAGLFLLTFYNDVLRLLS